MSSPLPLDLTTHQKFEQERLLRAINTLAANKDIEALRTMAAQFVRGFMTQRAAAHWALRQSMEPVSSYRPAAVPGISGAAPEVG
jgi:hypothetical protein